MFRLFLVFLVIFLIIRSFIVYGEGDKKSERKKDLNNIKPGDNKRISKEIGEYIDYEEVKK